MAFGIVSAALSIVGGAIAAIAGIDLSPEIIENVMDAKEGLDIVSDAREGMKRASETESRRTSQSEKSTGPKYLGAEEAKQIEDALKKFVKDKAKGPALETLCDLHANNPMLFSNVLNNNVKLLNATPVLTQMIALADTAKKPQAMFDMLGTIAETEDLKVNTKNKMGETAFSTALNYAVKPGNPLQENFQQMVFGLLENGAERRGKQYDNMMKAGKDSFDLGWLSKPRTATVEVTHNFDPKFGVTLPYTPYISPNNLEKIDKLLDKTQWKIDKTALEEKHYVNFEKIGQPENSIRAYRDKLTSKSKSLDTYVAMLEITKTTQPDGNKLKIKMPDATTQELMKQAFQQVYGMEPKPGVIAVKQPKANAVNRTENSDKNDSSPPPSPRHN